MKTVKGPHWIRHAHLLRRDEYECSVCGAVYKRRTAVCPKCGTALPKVSDRREWLDEAEEMDLMLDD